MHEINSINKRLRTVKHFSNYFLIALVITVLTIVIVLAAQGYDIDRQTGQVVQNGILLVETNPEGATVTINGHEEVNQTPSKYPIPEGSYTLSVDKEGYRNWSSQVEIFGSRVNWLYYPLLVPELINTSIVDNVDGLNIFAHIVGADRLVTSLGSNVRSLTVYDLSGNSPSSTPYAIPLDLLRLNDGAPRGQVALNSVSSDGRYLVLDYTGSNFKDRLLIDLDQPSRSFNVDDRFDQNFDEVQIDGETLYLTSEGQLYTRAITDAELGGPVTGSVQKVVFRSDNSPVLVRFADDQLFVAELAQPDVSLIDIEPETEFAGGNWEGSPYSVVKTSDELDIYSQLTAEDDSLPEKVLRFESGSSYSISPSERFIATHTTNKTQVYDYDTKLTHRFDIGIDSSITWLDGYRFAYDQDGQLYIVDFNGDNSYQIAGYKAEYGAFADSNAKAIYSISKSAVGNRLVLRSSSLDVDL